MLIGLTGGIATGKSTVARMLEDHGAVVIDADQISRDVVAPGADGLRQVIDTFGESVRNPDGGLDREAMGAIVFANPEARRKLEGILHPLIAQESLRRIQTALASRAPLVIYDAALLVETGRADDFRPLVVVSVDGEVQLARLMARDGLNRSEAEARVKSQMPLEEKAAHADFIIDNSGALNETRTQVESLVESLVNCNG